MKAPTRYTELLEAIKALDAAERSSKQAAERRGAMPPGSTRARATTANADWARKAEARDIKVDIAERCAVAALPGLMMRSDCK